MRIIINLKEQKAPRRGIAAMAKLDTGAKDTRRETDAGERLFAIVTAYLAQLETDDKTARETPVKKPGRLKRLVAWAKGRLGKPV